MSEQSNRREFLKQTALAGVGFWAAGGVSLAVSKSANEQINFACIGVGGKGDSDSDQVTKFGNVVAICDIDDDTLGRKAEKKVDGKQPFAKARKFNDFRKMFDEMGKEIDAVTVSTPDHTHAPASLMAMRLKKHVYCQKPLTHAVYEARLMRETAEKMGVATQMGNQGTAENGLRRAVELIRGGAIGHVHEVHVWTNRPIWPQGTDAILKVGAAREVAMEALHGRKLSCERPAVPKHVHWDLWLGPAAERPYDPIYHPFSWRGWWDFGTGAIGDMACHTANMAFMALKLDAPTVILAESGEINPETYPTWARIEFRFPARGDMPPVRLYWYEGASKEEGRILPPSYLTMGQKVSDSGSLLVGDKGILFSPNDYGASYTLLPEEQFEGYKGPEETLPRNGKGDEGMKAEWVNAIRGGKPALSNFDYAARLTEAMLLGDVAMRAGKEEEFKRHGRTHHRRRLEWDAEQLRAKNAPEAEQFIKPQYRKGYTLEG